MTSMCTNPVDPASQVCASAARRIWALRIKYATRALNISDNAIPMMTMRLLVPMPPRTARRMTTRRAPIIAKHARHQNSGIPSAKLGRECTVPKTTSTDAPPVTPKISGEASGLRAMVCVQEPAKPRAAPTITVAMATGRRKSHTTLMWFLLPPPVRTSITCRGLNAMGPCPSNTRYALRAMRMNASVEASTRTCRRRC